MRERIVVSLDLLTLGRNVKNVIAEPGWCSRVRRSSLVVDAYMDLTFHTGCSAHLYQTEGARNQPHLAIQFRQKDAR